MSKRLKAQIIEHRLMNWKKKGLVCVCVFVLHLYEAWIFVGLGFNISLEEVHMSRSTASNAGATFATPTTITNVPKTREEKKNNHHRKMFLTVQNMQF